MAAEARRTQVRAAVAEMRARIAAACTQAGRSADEVALVGVTKTRPATDADLLVELGVTDLGENRVDELAEKAGQVRSRPRWHHIGQLQTNKVRRLVAVPGLVAVHGVDRPKLVAALNRAVTDAGREPLPCYAQVDLDPRPDSGRGGVRPDDLAALADLIDAADALTLAGVMTVAPPAGDPDVAFGTLRDLAAAVRRRHPAAAGISAGMSGDFEVAIRHGATHVRVGALLLGERHARR